MLYTCWTGSVPSVDAIPDGPECGSGLGDAGSQHPMSVSYYKRSIEQYGSLQSQIQIVKNGKPHYMEVGVVTG